MTVATRRTGSFSDVFGKGLGSSQTISPSGFTSKKRAFAALHISVLPFGWRWDPLMEWLKKLQKGRLLLLARHSILPNWNATMRTRDFTVFRMARRCPRPDSEG